MGRCNLLLIQKAGIMSDIIFDIDVNTSSIKKKNAEVKADMAEMAQNVEKSGLRVEDMAEKAGNALGKMADKVPSISDKIKKEMSSSGQSIREMATEAQTQANQLNSTFKRLTTAVAGFFTINYVSQFAMKIATVRGEFQQMEVAFNTMLQSKEKADSLMSEVVQLAATTPFTLEQVGAGAKQLLAYQVPADEVIDTLTRLGNVSAGLSVPIDRLILAYGQVKAKGKLMGDDLRQFTEAGVPMVHELAKQMGVADSQVSKLIETGRVGFPEVQQVINNLTNSGGMFYNMMVEQSKTITGQISNLHDAFDRMLNDLGKSHEGPINDVIAGLSTLVSHYEILLKVLEEMIAVYGVYKAALMAVAVANKIKDFRTITETVMQYTQAGVKAVEVTRTMTLAETAHALATKSSNAAASLLNKTLIKNPYIVVAAALGILVSTLYIFWNRTTEADKVLKNHIETQKKYSDQLEDEKAKTEALVDTARNDKASKEERIKAINQLKEISGGYLNSLDLENIKTSKGAQLLANYNKQLKARIFLEATQEEKKKIIKDEYYAYISLNNAKYHLNRYDKTNAQSIPVVTSYGVNANVVDPTRANYQKQIEDARAWIKAIDVEKKSLDNEEAKYSMFLSGKVTSEVKKNVSERKKEIKAEIIAAQKELQKMRSPGSFATDEAIAGQVKNVEDLTKKLKTLTGVDTKKEDSKRNRDLKKRQAAEKREQQEEHKAAADKLKGKEELAKKELELNQKLEDSKLAIISDGVVKQKAEVEVAYQNELNQIQEQENGILKALNDSKGIKPLNKNGSKNKNYITTIPTDLTDKDGNNIAQSLSDQRANAKKAENDKIEKIDSDAADKIKAINDGITEKFISDLEREKRAINSKYDDWVKQAEDLGQSQSFIDNINEQRKKELAKADNDSALELSDYYRKAFGDIEKYGYQTIKKLAAETGDIVNSAKSTKVNGQTFMIVDIPTIDKEGKEVKKQVSLTVDEFTKLQAKYVELNKATEDKNPFATLGASFKSVVASLKSGNKDDLSNALTTFDSSVTKSIAIVNDWSDSLSQIFGSEISTDVKTLTQLAAGATEVGTGVAQLASGDIVEGVTNTLKGVANIYTTLTAGSKKYKEDQEKWTSELINLQLEYNAVLNEQIRLQMNSNSSVFITDNAKAAVNATEALIDSQKKYNDTLKDKSLKEFLSDLEIKIGVAKKKFLGITTGSKNVYGSLYEKYHDLIKDNGEFNDELAKTLLNLDGIPAATKDALNQLIAYQEQIKTNEDAIGSAINSLAGSISSNLKDSLVSAWDAGTDSFAAFKASVSKGIKDIIDQTVFNAVFSKQFKQLQNDMEASFGENGDQSVTDDVAKLLTAAPELIAKWKEAMKSSEDAAKASGFDFSSTDTSTDTSMQGAIKQEMTEETAGKLEGTFRSIRDYSKQQLDANLNAANHLVMIEANTARAAVATEDTVNRLDKAITELQNISKNTKPSQSARDMGIKL